jgi:hypothetical protein
VKNTIRIIALVLLAACLAWATTVRPMSVDRLTQVASDVVEARVTQTWSEWDAQHTRIYTYSQLAVTRSLKGSQGSTVLVKQPGGTKDGITEVVFGVRHFRPGEDSVLFLEPSRDNDGAMRVVGLMQGNFLVFKSNGELKVSNGIPNVTTVTTGGQLAPYTGAHMTLQELESRVTKAVAQ